MKKRSQQKRRMMKRLRTRPQTFKVTGIRNRLRMALKLMKGPQRVIVDPRNIPEGIQSQIMPLPTKRRKWK